jgi:hypothetical protein
MTNTAGFEIPRIAHYAEIAAYLAHFPPHDHAEIIARFGLRGGAWETASAEWWATRGAELAERRTELSSRFVRAFVTTAERLQAKHVPLEGIGPLPYTFRIEAAPAPAPPPLVRAEGEPPAVALAWVPAGAEDLGAPSFREQAPALTLSPGAIEPVPSLSPGPSDLTIEQYTSLRVELHLLPNRAAVIVARYGIRPEEQEALFARWRTRFEADPQLRLGFARGYAEYLAWVRESPGALEAIARRYAAAP